MVLLSSFVGTSDPLAPRLASAGIRASAGCEPGVIISGHSRSGKSSLAFQAAVSAACAGHAVAYLCAEEVLQSKMPHPQAALEDLPGDVLSRIEFQYVSSLQDVRQYASVSMHEAPGFGDDHEPARDAAMPAVIVVDDDGLGEAHTRLEVAKTLAVLEDAVAWLRANSRFRGGHDELGPHTAFFVYVTNQPVPGAWQDGPPASGPFAQLPLHVVTRHDAATNGGSVTGDARCVAVVWTTDGAVPVDGPVAALHFNVPAEGTLKMN